MFGGCCVTTHLRTLAQICPRVIARRGRSPVVAVTIKHQHRKIRARRMSRNCGRCVTANDEKSNERKNSEHRSER